MNSTRNNIVRSTSNIYFADIVIFVPFGYTYVKMSSFTICYLKLKLILDIHNLNCCLNPV